MFKTPTYRLNLNFDQKLQLWQFRVRVLLSLSAFYLAMFALLFDLGIAKRYAPWLTSLASFIIGWWMPSPGNPALTQNNSQVSVSSDQALVVANDER